MKANKLGDNGSQEQPRREIMQGDERRQGNSGSQHQPRREIRKTDKSRPEGKSGRENSWETKQQWQPRAAQKGNHEGRTAGRQSNSGSQEQTRREIMKGDQLGDKATVAAKSRPEGKWAAPEGKSGRENSWETKQQRQPRAAQKGNHEGRQGGSDFLTIRRFRKSGTQPLRSKNPYSFQLSRE